MAIDFEKIEQSPHLLDVLVQMEDVLDTFDIYVFENWIKGEIVDGPKVRRYWFDFTLRYNIDTMPDPQGAKRLIKHGVRINYHKVSIENEDGTEPEEPNAWEITMSIPSRLIKNMNAAELDIYNSEVDSEDIEDALDAGETDQSGFVDTTDTNYADPESAGEEVPDEL